MIAYICSVYLGPRKSKLSNKYWDKDPYFNVRQHLETLQQLQINSISRIIFVVSRYNSFIDSKLQEIVNEYQLKNVSIRYRSNRGFSYAAWNETIKSLLEPEDIKYFFCIEDDYVLNNDEVLDKFIEKFNSTSNVGFVCQYWENEHAAVSNGLLSKDVALQLNKKHGDIFNVSTVNDSYETAVNNQRFFLKHMDSESMKLLGMNDVFKTIFFESSNDSFETLGLPKTKDLSIGIKPIQDFGAIINIKETTSADIILSLKDYYKEFVIDETKTNEYNKIYKILYFDECIGYISTYNYSSINKFCYLEICIDPTVVCNKIASVAFTKFINEQKHNLHKIVVETCLNNPTGIKFLSAMGFNCESTKKYHIFRNNEYHDSVEYVYFLKK